MSGRAECRLDFSRKFLLVAAVMSVAIPGVFGQVNAAQSAAAADSTVAKLPVYDVVSIKPNKSGSGSVSIDANNDSFFAENISVKRFLQYVYDIKEDLIFGVPGSIGSAHFDIEAKIVEPDRDALKKLDDERRRSMLRPVLAERFQFRAHTEIKALPIYELIVVKNGPKLKRSPNNNKRDSGASISNYGRRRELASNNCPMVLLARTLSAQVHRTVIDKTGLTGDYDFALKWSPDDGSDTPGDSAPSIFTALPEQLGLKLQPAKGPVATLVVDHVEMPSEN